MPCPLGQRGWPCPLIPRQWSCLHGTGPGWQPPAPAQGGLCPLQPGCSSSNPTDLCIHGSTLGVMLSSFPLSLSISVQASSASAGIIVSKTSSFFHGHCGDPNHWTQEFFMGPSGIPLLYSWLLLRWWIGSISSRHQSLHWKFAQLLLGPSQSTRPGQAENFPNLPVLVLLPSSSFLKLLPPSHIL